MKGLRGDHRADVTHWTCAVQLGRYDRRQHAQLVRRLDVVVRPYQRVIWVKVKVKVVEMKVDEVDECSQHTARRRTTYL